MWHFIYVILLSIFLFTVHTLIRKLDKWSIHPQISLHYKSLTHKAYRFLSVLCCIYCIQGFILFFSTILNEIPKMDITLDTHLVFILTLFNFRSIRLFYRLKYSILSEINILMAQTFCITFNTLHSFLKISCDMQH